MNMRNVIRQRLVQQVPEIEGRVVELNTVSASLDKPYIVLTLGTETVDKPWIGNRVLFDVWSSVSSEETFGDVDELAESIMNALNDQVVEDANSEIAFTCRFEGLSNSDSVDTALGVISRGLRFSATVIRNTPTTEEEDDWLVALAEWSRGILGSEWQISTKKWPADTARPSLLWRVDGVQISEGNAAIFEMRKNVVGHVLGRTTNEQAEGAAILARSLGADAKLPLSLVDRRYLSVSDLLIDRKADAWTSGQLFFTLSRKIIRPSMIGETPLMQEVHFANK